jgi:hypothetical protein
MEDDDYGSYDTENTNEESLDTLQEEFGSHQYVPKTFLGMETSKLGFHIVNQPSPFLELKNKIINEASTLKVEDRMQAVRYLCSIPYVNGTAHCVEAAMSIIKDESIDIYTRFYFFASNEKYFRLDDHVSYYCFPGFFKYGLKAGSTLVPYELMIKAAAFIIRSFDADQPVRQTALDWCLDIIESDFEDIQTKLRVLRVFKDLGQIDEQMYADDQLEQLGIEDINEVEIDVNEKMAVDLLRALRTAHKVGEDTPENLFVDLCNHQEVKDGRITPDEITIFFNDYVNSGEKFDGVTISDIMVLMMKEINKLKTSTGGPHVVNEVLFRLLNCIQNNSNVVDILNCLSNFTEPVSFSIGPSLFERLRNEIFAALNKSLLALNEGLREEVEKSRNSKDKAACKEFLIYFDDEKEIMCKQFQKEGVSPKEFEDTFDKVSKEWMN